MARQKKPAVHGPEHKGVVWPPVAPYLPGGQAVLVALVEPARQ